MDGFVCVRVCVSAGVCVCVVLCVFVCVCVWQQNCFAAIFNTGGFTASVFVQPRREVYSQADLSKTSGIFCWVSPFSMGKC
jgi:hypothetical protein